MADEYKVVTISGTENLAREVNDALRDGWQPVGGVSGVMLHGTDGLVIFASQAMIRYGPSADAPPLTAQR